MFEKSRASSTNAVALVFHTFLLFGSIVVNSIVVFSNTLIMGMLMDIHSVPVDPVPCPKPCIGDSSVFI